MRHYEGTDGHPYIHDTKTNGTTKEIVDYQYGMLAFDKDGNPLKIDWWSLDTEVDSTYFYLEEASVKISPAETYDARGGWSLNLMGNDSCVANIAFVLYCDKEITFQDGTVWENPDFESWRNTYEGKKIDVDILESYYPYEQEIMGLESGLQQAFCRSVSISALLARLFPVESGFLLLMKLVLT